MSELYEEAPKSAHGDFAELAAKQLRELWLWDAEQGGGPAFGHPSFRQTISDSPSELCFDEHAVGGAIAEVGIDIGTPAATVCLPTRFHTDLPVCIS